MSLRFVYDKWEEREITWFASLNLHDSVSLNTEQDGSGSEVRVGSGGESIGPTA